MMKWPERLEPIQVDIGVGNMESGYEHGFNDAIDACRAAVEGSCDKEKLAEVILKIGTEWELFDDPITPLCIYIADAIRQHLGIENKEKTLRKEEEK